MVGTGTGEMEGKGYGCQRKGREWEGKGGRRRGADGRKVRTPPPSIPHACFYNNLYSHSAARQ